MNIVTSLVELFVLAIPVACVSWTVTHEEIFREPREYCIRRSKKGKCLLERKFFYLFTCEYCFSHYVVILFLIITHFTLLYGGWRGYVVSGFALVFVANVYMSLYNMVRIDIKLESTEIALKEEETETLHAAALKNRR